MKFCIITFYKKTDSVIENVGTIPIVDENVVDEIIEKKFFDFENESLKFIYNETEYISSLNYKIENNDDNLVQFIKKLVEKEGVKNIELYYSFSISLPIQFVIY